MTQRITAMTLVDITNSESVRVRESNTKEYHQQQNLNVLLQTISLRAQPIDPVVRQFQQVELKDFQFGEFYDQEVANVWSLTFYFEHEFTWSDGEDELAHLKSDTQGVAITPDLDNTVEFPINILDTINDINIYFKIN